MTQSVIADWTRDGLYHVDDVSHVWWARAAMSCVTKLELTEWRDVTMVPLVSKVAVKRASKRRAPIDAPKRLLLSLYRYVRCRCDRAVCASRYSYIYMPAVSPQHAPPSHTARARAELILEPPDPEPP
eukprot:CAMPEP_0205919350 /NCGR_PEP_ID=MMETSP1325-20131115/10384_2 /ASSEMBLY_ACC=CAM_ASM_000708 /TAXON_ID=236786 /ORGANISM="Florenciella sp., Strain RCC1007" /LENGTH=127 /DNA_ID=CAMNT_0053286949 /DNA_START=324 /DNA_END=709 /DNA_ORIENTATION=-